MTQQEIDPNRELTIAGMSNLAIGLFGGILSFHSLSKSYQFKERTRQIEQGAGMQPGRGRCSKNHLQSMPFKLVSMLAHKLGSNRLATLIDAGVFLAIPTIGASLLSYCPKPVLGGLLLYLGLSLLIEWVIAAWSKLSLSDYLVVQVVLIVSATVGFLQGLTVGWLVAVGIVAIGSVKTQFEKSK